MSSFKDLEILEIEIWNLKIHIPPRWGWMRPAIKPGLNSLQ